MICEIGIHTHVSHASPNIIRHAGSRDWKYSSGWKNVRTVRALMRRKDKMEKNIKEWDEKDRFLLLGVELCGEGMARRLCDDVVVSFLDDVDWGSARLRREQALAEAKLAKPSANLSLGCLARRIHNSTLDLQQPNIFKLQSTVPKSLH